MQPDLARSLAEHAYLREHLLAEYRESIDDETLRDTLEGISSLPEALAAVVRSYLDDLVIASALGMRIGDMQERLSRVEARAEKKRVTITSVMEKADLKKLEQPDFTASLRAVPPARTRILTLAVYEQSFVAPRPSCQTQSAWIVSRSQPSKPKMRLASAIACQPSI